jgi:hypothetical protein
VERLQSRLLRVMTAVTSLFVVAIIVVPVLVRRPPQPIVIGLIGSSAQALAPTLRDAARAADVQITVAEVTDAATARSRLHGWEP